MPPPAPDDPALAELCAADPPLAVLRVLREAGAGLTSSEVQRRLADAGVTEDEARATWRRAQRVVRWNEQVVRADGRYVWASEPVILSADEALDLLALSGAPARVRRALVDLVRAALSKARGGGADELPEGDGAAVARQRQAEIDAVRAVAELAMEVEELAANEASANTVVHRVRARAQRSGLEPIERAGEESTFDRTRHRPIDGIIRDGATVVVVKPGYVWRSPAEDVLIAKAVVEE